MTDLEWREKIDEIDDPSEVLEELQREWRDRRDAQEAAVDEADGLEETQVHRGRRRALEYGVAWLDGSEIDEEPLEVIKTLCGRLAGAATKNPGLSNAGSVIGPQHSGFTDELNAMIVQSRETRGSLQERWGEPTDLDEMPWVNERVRKNVAKAWGYEE